MIINNETVAQLAKAANLNLEPNELPSYTQHLVNFLQLIEPLTQIDTTKIEPVHFAVKNNNEK